MSESTKYERYESEELKEWKKLDAKIQLEKVQELSVGLSDKLEIVRVHDQAIEVSLFVEKSEVYDFLVSYETLMRTKLGNFPIVVLLKDRADENKKRK